MVALPIPNHNTESNDVGKPPERLRWEFHEPLHVDLAVLLIIEDLEVANLGQSSQEVTKLLHLLSEFYIQGFSITAVIHDHASIAIDLFHCDLKPSHQGLITCWDLLGEFVNTFCNQIARGQSILVNELDIVIANFDEEGAISIQRSDAFTVDLSVRSPNGRSSVPHQASIRNIACARQDVSVNMCSQFVRQFQERTSSAANFQLMGLLKLASLTGFFIEGCVMCN